MLRSGETVLTIFLAALLAATTGLAAPTQPEKSTGVVAPTSAAEKAEQDKKLAEATDAAKRLLLLMDTDKSGKVSREEWMKFMAAEFDRLDTNHDGQLDVKELIQSRMRYRPAPGK
ncbi:MAG: hypothetical protein WBX02_21180 [Terriglobales bacterium]